MNEEKLFCLSDDFVEDYARRTPRFGFNGLGELVFMHHYSRIMDNGKKERWVDTLRRVAEGTWNTLAHVKKKQQNGSSFHPEFSARDMFKKMWEMKFLPPGRGLWAMGTAIPREKGGAALNNCAFISTSDFEKSPSEPFAFAMDMLMLGVGVGFDTKGAGNYSIRTKDVHYVSFCQISDTREGWVDSLNLLLDYWFQKEDAFDAKPLFSYHNIRKKGTPLKIFGGKASGSGPLIELHEEIDKLMKKNMGRSMSQGLIVDIMNMIGRCVVAGNIRRSAELAIGDATAEFLDLKDYDKRPERAAWGWCSNNSVNLQPNTDYQEIADRIAKNGEPGVVWLDNMREYGRMCEPAGGRDPLAKGTNPCGEQTLESGELCCLVEVFINHHTDVTDFMNTLWHAYHYAKAVTTIPVHNPKTQKIIERNRRMGISLTGIAQFLARESLDTLRSWLGVGYAFLSGIDVNISRQLGIVPSIKLTCIKPSGTVSLLGGATPGMHYPLSRFYWRRMRLGNGDSKLAEHLTDVGYQVDRDPYDEKGWVVTFAVDVGVGVRTLDHVGMWEQILLASFLQRYWADNQVSCTVSFTKEEAKEIAVALPFFASYLKSISFLPRGDDVYPLMPYQKITSEQYDDYVAKAQPLCLEDVPDSTWTDPEEETRCDGDQCQRFS